MFKSIIIMVKSISGIERRINIDALYLASIVLFQCLKCKKVISMDEHIVKYVVIAFFFCVIRFFRHFD